MTRKRKKPQAGGDALAAPAQPIPAVIAVDPPRQELRLQDLQRLARQHVDANAWGELAALGRTPLSQVCSADQKDAEILLMRARIIGNYPDPSLSVHSLQAEARAEVEAAVVQLANKLESFHREPEFDLYLDMLGYSIEDCVTAFNVLTRACMDAPKPEWVRRLRGRALRLADPYYDDDGPTEEQLQLVASVPDVYVVLSEVYATAETSTAFEGDGRLLLKVLKQELDMRMADPWDYGRVAESLARWPSPSVEALATSPRVDDGRHVRQQLTPKAWAFMWELGNTNFAGFANLLERYPGEFGNDACDGLSLVVRGLVANPAECDANLAAAVRMLMRYASGWTEWVGDSVTLDTPEGPHEVSVGYGSLDVPAVDALMLRLFENTPDKFKRRDEMECLYRIFSASVNYSPLEDEDYADESMPGLAWLCEQSIPFQFAASIAIQGVAGRMRLLLEGLRRSLEAGLPPPDRYYTGDLTGEDLSSETAGPVLEAISRLVPLREQMDEDSQSLWRSVVEGIFSALSRVDERSVRARTLELAQEFEEDLLAQGDSFGLAYLEQVVGDPEEALRFYLINFDTSKELEDGAVKNAKLLWHRADDLDQVQAFVDMLQDAATNNRRADVVRQLLADAKEKLAALNQQAQFEKTAVNRWPSLTAPARKVLGVLATIQSYTGFRELGEYAGMGADWAERHYDKLVELGMVMTTDKGYRINPSISPLLERESQHAIVGRIVRAQGTSAVKQVFNSQREFTIYQVMVQLCPNHLVFPNSSLQSIMSFDRMKELASDDDFGYYLRASVDIVVVSSTTYLPMLAIEVDSVWHDTERQQKNDGKKDRLFAAAGIPFMRLRPVGSPSENGVRAQVAEHLDELVRTLRVDLPGYEQARGLLQDLSDVPSAPGPSNPRISPSEKNPT